MMTFTSSSTVELADYHTEAGTQSNLYLMQLMSQSFGAIMDQIEGQFFVNEAMDINVSEARQAIEAKLAQHDLQAIQQIVVMMLTFLARAYQRALQPGP